MKKKVIQSTYSDDDSNDIIDEDDLVGELVVHNDMSKYTNGNKQESTLEVQPHLKPRTRTTMTRTMIRIGTLMTLI